MKKVLCSLMFVFMCAASGGAQDAAANGAQAQEAAAKLAGNQTPAPPADAVNVRYEITIRETGGKQPSTKSVSLVLAMGEQSAVRANATDAGRGHPLNVDVYPHSIRDNKIRSRIGFEYTPSDNLQGGPPALVMRQTLNVWLDNGKPLVVSEAADPISDRRFTVSVTATIVR